MRNNPGILFPGAILLLGLLVLLGWTAGLPALTRLRPGWSAMQPLTAVSFVMAGLALSFFARRQRRRAGALLLPLAAIPAATLMQYWTGHPLGIDTLLFPAAVMAQTDLLFPGRMPQATAVELLLFCLFLAWPRRSSRRYRQASRIATLGLLLASIGLVGYLLGARELARLGSYTSMAAHTAFGFILLFTGALLAQRDPHWLHGLLSPSAGARAVRRLLVYVLGLTVLLGLLVPVVDPLIDNPHLEFAVFVVAFLLALVIGLVRFAKRFDRAEDRRRRAEVAFATAEVRLGRIMDTIQDAIVTIDDSQRVVYFNPAAEKAFGYPATEVIGSRVEGLIPARFRTAHAGQVSHFGETGVTNRRMGKLGALSALRKDGMEFPVEASISQVEMDGRKLYTAILRDITERKQAEDLLRASEERLKLFIRYAPASLAMFDSEMRYLAASRRWQDDYQLGTADIVGRCHYELFPNVPERWKEAHRRGLAGEVLTNEEDRFEREDGSMQWLRWELRPWHTGEGAVGGIVIFAEDITGYKLALEEIQHLNSNLERRVQERTAELTAANRELDSFAYAVSHDLRAPLRAMTGFSQILEESHAAQLGREALRYLQQIRLACRKMSDLIDGILALSRITREELRRDRIDLSAMAERLLEGLAAGEPGRRVHWEVESGLVAWGDAGMIESVMTNLLDNAWKYTARTPDAVIRVYRDDGGFCVADNGAGFDQNYGAKLFQPFQRLHRQEEFPGIGIGLATVQRIIQRHGGKISATAAPGQGALFRFSLDGSGTASESGKSC